MKLLVEAMEMLRAEMERANVRLDGRMLPLITIQFTATEDEAIFHAYLRAEMQNQDMFQMLRDHRRAHHEGLRRNCIASIAGLNIRLSSDDRIDDFVSRLLK